MAMVARSGTPTPYYYGVRAELFLHDAEQALMQGDTTKHAQLMVRATHYQTLAGQLPLEKGHNDHTEIPYT
jgi:hypothetical protein